LEQNTYNIRQGLFKVDPHILDLIYLALVVLLESRNTWSVFLLRETFGNFLGANISFHMWLLKCMV